MARVKRYIDRNVLDEAKRRLHHVHDIFDGLVVMFSGGKDSLVTLHLCREVAAERGDTRPVRAVFRDEELIPEAVVQFVAEMRDEPWLDLEWWAVPMDSQRSLLGQVETFTTFDPSRPPLREPPPYALRSADLGLSPTTVIDQRTADDLSVRNVPGKVAIVTGVRAAESLMRYRSCVNKLHENYIVASSCARAQMVRPIYDWLEGDVFRYLYDRGVRYCPAYDAQAWAGEPLRVSTPLHPEAAKRLAAVREHAPDLYERVLTLFPDMAVQARYWDEYDGAGIIERYGQDWGTIREWIDTYCTAEWRAKAHAELDSVITRAARVPESYPPAHVLRTLMSTSGKKVVQPMRPDDGRRLQERARA